MSPPGSSPFPAAVGGSGGSAPLSEERAKPSHQGDQFGSPELLIAPMLVRHVSTFKIQAQIKTVHRQTIFYSRSLRVRYLAAFNWNHKSFNRQNKCWSESSSQFYILDPLNGPCMHLAISASTTNEKFLCLQYGS